MQNRSPVTHRDPDVEITLAGTSVVERRVQRVPDEVHAVGPCAVEMYLQFLDHNGAEVFPFVENIEMYECAVAA